MKIIVLLFLFAIFNQLHAYNPDHIALLKQNQSCEGCDFNLLNATPELLGKSDFPDAVVTGSYFYGTSMARLNLQRLNAREMNAVGLLLHDNDLTDADFSYSDISRLKVTHWNKGDRVKFVGAFLSGSDFSYTAFEAPNFHEAYLKNASLYRVKWPGADLSGAALLSADLTFAQLSQANLERADLTGATTSHVDFSGANLLHAKISPDQLKRTLSLCGAILPDGGVGACHISTAD